MSALSRSYSGIVSNLAWHVTAFVLALGLLPWYLPVILIFHIYSSITKKRIERDTEGQATVVANDDAIWLQDRADNMAVINCLMLLKGKPNVNKWQENARENLVEARDKYGQKLFPKMSCYCTKILGRDVWIPVPDFEIKDYCYTWSESVPKSRTEVESLLGYLCSQSLPERRARWQLVIVPTYSRMEELYYVLIRVHHAIADGVSLTNILMTKMVEVPSDTSVPVRFGSKGNFKRTLKAIFSGCALLIERFTWPADQHCFHGKKLSGDKIQCWSEQIDLNIIKRMKEAGNYTVNDVLMSCIASAFRETFKQNSSDVPENILAHVPVDIRPQSDALVMNNQISFVFVPLPLNIEDPVVCLKEVKRRMDAMKNSGESVVGKHFMSFAMSKLPNLITQKLFDYMSDKGSLVLSNIPGPQQKMFICGNPIEDMIFWPPQRSNVGMGISIFSYNGHVKIGVVVDRCIMANPAALVRRFEEKVYQLAKIL